MNVKAFSNNSSETPESCGFAIRTFRINIPDTSLEIKNPKNRQLEQKINLSDIKGILLDPSTKQIIKQKKLNITKPNQEIDKLILPDYIQISLLIVDGKLEIIAPTFQIFNCFQAAIEEIVKNKKNLKGILSLVESR